jgi:hypothetical protein
MNVTKVLGLAAVGALLALAAPAQSALALSLVNPGAAAAVQESSKEVSGATEVHWRRHHHHHHHHRWHRHHRHHYWHHRHHHHHGHRW